VVFPLICESPLRGFRLALPCVTLPAHVLTLYPHVIQHCLEVADPLFEQGSAYGFHESRVTPRFTPGYGSFRRIIRTRYVREGRVNPVQLAGLDAPLPKFIFGAADSARLDASEYGGLRHSDRSRGLP
jgi:hypothetical protein